MTAKIPTGLIHATSVAINGSGLLITGPSGCGKSGLAIQLIALGAILVSDDQTLLVQTPSGIEMRAPVTIGGKIEARFLGILECAYLPSTQLSFVVSLEQDEPDRLPQPRKIVIGSAQIDLINGANVPNLASALMVRFSGP